MSNSVAGTADSKLFCAHGAMTGSGVYLLRVLVLVKCL